MNGQWLGTRAIRTNWATRKPPAPKDGKTSRLFLVPILYFYDIFHTGRNMGGRSDPVFVFSLLSPFSSTIIMYIYTHIHLYILAAPCLSVLCWKEEEEEEEEEMDLSIFFVLLVRFWVLSPEIERHSRANITLAFLSPSSSSSRFSRTRLDGPWSKAFKKRNRPYRKTTTTTTTRK